MKNYSYLDTKLILKKVLIFLIIAFPFMLALATLLAVLNAPVWAIFVCTIMFGGAVFLLEYIIYIRRKEKQDEQRKTNYDPFKD